MTSVSPTASPTAPAPAANSATKSKMDYDAFLRLFIAQMKNQDPTKPNDPTQTLAQLASFSNVEQSIKLNQKLDALVTSSNASLSAVLIGKRLTSLDGSISGVVTGVEQGSNGLTAYLEGGKTLPLGNGYRLGAA